MNSKLKPWLIWFIASLFLFYDILLRVFPNILVKELQGHYHINAFELGQLSAGFMWGYGLMQIPAGILIDRFGIRRAVSSGCLLATIGVVILWLSPYFWLACVSRFIMGCGAAFAFLGCMQVIFEWFVPQRKALLTGLTMTVGAGGGIVCNSLLIRLVNAQHWHWLLAGIIGFGLFLFLLLLSFVKNNPNSEKTSIGKSLLSGIGYVLKSPLSWVTGLICGFIYLPYAIFNDLWGVPFFQIVDHFLKNNAGNVISGIWLGWLLGSPLIGYLGDRFGCLKMMAYTTLVQLSLLLLLLYIHWNNMHWMVYALSFCLGVMAAAMSLCYVFGQQFTPAYAVGANTAFINTLVTAVVFTSLPLIGKVMDSAASLQGIHPLAILNYPGIDFQYGLSALTVALVLGLLFLAWAHRLRQRKPLSSQPN